MALISMMTAVLFIQEQVLTWIPNFQLTFLLIILFSKTFGTKATLLIVFVHVVLDIFIYGGPVWVLGPAMIFSYSIIPITLNSVFKNIKSEYGLASISILYGFIYSWVFIIPQTIVYGTPVAAYLAQDILFELSLVVSNFLTVFILYNPLKKAIDNLYLNFD